MDIVKRFDIWTANIAVREKSCIQNGFRPVIIVSNDIANTHSSVVTIVPLTSKNKKPLPTHVLIDGQGLAKPSTVLCEQVTSIDKFDLCRCIGHVEKSEDREAICHAIGIQLSMAA